MTRAQLTPVEDLHNGVRVKRDDLFTYAGERGGKVRTCLALAQTGPAGAPLVTPTTLEAPQQTIVAAVGAALGRQVHLHVPQAKRPMSPTLERAVQLGAVVHRHHPGYTTVLSARARDHAQQLGAVHVPWNMECAEAIGLTGAQVDNLPDDTDRLVVSVGSGMTLAGILCGLRQRGRLGVPVVGVMVGGNPVRTLDRWAPPDWRTQVTLVVADVPYSHHVQRNVYGTLDLDPQYEAKTIPYLRNGDVLWVTGHRDPLTTA